MKYLAIVLGFVVLTGCSSTHKMVVDQTQYCHTSSTTVLKNQTISSSETVFECTDKPNPKAVWQKHGYDESKCGWARQSYPVGGKLVTSYTMACQLQDGSWTYVPNVIAQ